MNQAKVSLRRSMASELSRRDITIVKQKELESRQIWEAGLDSASSSVPVNDQPPIVGRSEPHDIAAAGIDRHLQNRSEAFPDLT